jgi:uncharacterized protein YecT (DUF1311 family)
MRWTATLMLLAILCAGFPGCDSDQAETEEQTSTRSIADDLEPPVISEQFTLLPCPAKPKSTLDFEGCAEHRILKSDKAINEIVGVIFARLRHSSSGAARRFVRSERAWLTYRRSACESRADIYEGGSAAGIVFAECVAARNVAHLSDLTAFERNLGPK